MAVWTVEHIALVEADSAAWSWELERDQLEWSDTAHAILGVSRTRLGVRMADFLELMDPADRLRVQCALQRAITTTSDWADSFRLTAAPARWIHTRGRVLRDEHGGATRMVGVVRSKNDASALDVERLEYSCLMQAALDASLFAVVVLDPSGQIVYCNELAADLLGLTRSTAESRTFDAPQFKHTDLEGGPWPNEKQPFVRVMRTGQPVRGVEHAIERPDGRRILLRINGAPIKGEQGEVKLVVCSFEDITERKAIEEAFRQSQKMEAVGRLAGGVAHDFNNLLTAIVSFASLAREEIAESERVLDSLDGIVESAERAAQLTKQLLVFARRDTPRSVGFDARVETAAAARLIARVVGAHVALELELGDEPCWVEMDPNQLQQVLLNLAVNARDAMPSGGRLKLSVQRDAQRRSVSLSVADTGHGMDPATLQRALEPFFTTKPAHLGTGLGLATCHGIVARSGGQIRLSSELGRGTRVEIELPLTAAPAAPSLEHGVPEIPTVQQGRILLVEDDPAVQSVALRTLARAGYDVCAALTPRQAIALFAEQPTDLVICDLVLPQMSGPTLIDRLRAIDPSVRVLFVSGYSSELSQADATNFLAKPYTPEVLRARVASLLAARP